MSKLAKAVLDRLEAVIDDRNSADDQLQESISREHELMARIAKEVEARQELARLVISTSRALEEINNENYGLRNELVDTRQQHSDELNVAHTEIYDLKARLQTLNTIDGSIDVRRNGLSGRVYQHEVLAIQSLQGKTRVIIGGSSLVSA